MDGARAAVIVQANLSNRYSTEWHFPNDANHAALCYGIPTLDPDDIEDLVQREISHMAEIAQLEPNDTVDSIVFKLKSTSCIQEYDKAYSDVQTRIDKVQLPHGSSNSNHCNYHSYNKIQSRMMEIYESIYFIEEQES